MQADCYALPASWRSKAAKIIRALAVVSVAPVRDLWRAVGVALWAVIGLQQRLHNFSALLQWISDTAKVVANAPQGWNLEIHLSQPAMQCLLRIVTTLLEKEIWMGPPPQLPNFFQAVIYSDASEKGGGVVIFFQGSWWAAWWPWPAVFLDESIFFLEGRALIRGLQFAINNLSIRSVPILLRCDNQPFVQASQRGCSTTRLGNLLIAVVDNLVAKTQSVAVEWISTETMLADAFSRIPMGAKPPGAGKAGDLVALDSAPFDSLGRQPIGNVGLPSANAKMLSVLDPVGI